MPQGVFAAGAVVERAQHLRAGRIALVLEPPWPATGPTISISVASVMRRPYRLFATAAQALVCLLDLDRAAAVRHQLDLGLLRRLRPGAQPAKHQRRIRVLVIDVEQTVVGAVGAARQRKVADEIIVVAELLRLGAGALRHRIQAGASATTGSPQRIRTRAL